MERHSPVHLPNLRLRISGSTKIANLHLGLSFALSNAADIKDIAPWTKFPGNASHNSEHCHKAPSWIAYADENEDLDEDAWGYQIEPGMKTYAWTKLLLDSAAAPTEYDDPGLRTVTGNGIMWLPPGKTAKEVATDYLRGMHRMFNDAIKEKMGDEICRNLPMEFWLTVPATWTEQAKQETRQAALDAGFVPKPSGPIHVIPEPEAAAHLALKETVGRVEDLIQVRRGILSPCTVAAGLMSCRLGQGSWYATVVEELS